MKGNTDSIDAVARDVQPRRRDALPALIGVAVVLAMFATASLLLDYCLACL